MKTSDRDRVMSVFVSERDMRDVLAGLARICNLPDDAQIESSHQCFRSKGFYFIVHSMSFPIFEGIGEMMPSFQALFENQRIAVKFTDLMDKDQTPIRQPLMKSDVVHIDRELNAGAEIPHTKISEDELAALKTAADGAIALCDKRLDELASRPGKIMASDPVMDFFKGTSK